MSLANLSACWPRRSGGSNAAEVVLGLLSLVFWALMIVVTAKYVLFVMRADNDAEGGISRSLAWQRTPRPISGAGPPCSRSTLPALLFYSDGMIIPTISVLSAVKDLQVAAPLLRPYVISIGIAVLIVLFVVQSRGSERIGAYFGPVMALWFAVLAIAGLVQVVREPGVLAALNPLRAMGFLAGHGSSRRRWLS